MVLRSSPSNGEILTLSSGRKMGISRYGSPQGHPVIYFHGFPGSRVEAMWGEELAREMKILLIAPDRPGYGLSSANRDSDLFSFASDVEEMVQLLGLEQLSLVGVSGGGPYALGSAWVLGRRVRSVGLVGSIAPPGGEEGRILDPLNRIGLWIFRQVPLLGRFLIRLFAAFGRRVPKLVILAIALRSAPKDRALLLRSPLSSVLSASFREALVQGGKGMERDVALYSSQWGTFLSQLQSKVFIWHGKEDRLVPWQMALSLRRRLPNSELFLLPGEGHFSIFQGFSKEILERIRFKA
jgi:pimeloyl-ACP methyl ester carboxylesterase